jgi:hypothetical protein
VAPAGARLVFQQTDVPGIVAIVGEHGIEVDGEGNNRAATRVGNLKARRTRNTGASHERIGQELSVGWLSHGALRRDGAICSRVTEM